MSAPITVHALPAFADNYLWTLVRGDQAVVVDPGDGAVVQRFLESQQLQLSSILVTHHHSDHIGGIAELRQHWDVPVHGPRAEHAKIAALTVLLDDGNAVEIFDETYTVLALPGHTLGHIAYYSATANDGNGRLFCGDTLFSAGCGRLFEGTPAQMHQSLQRLAALPGETAVYCTHEYTASNLAFARAVEPLNADVLARSDEVSALREQDRPSLPTTIAAERRFNPFLRTAAAAVRSAAETQAAQRLADETAVFTTLRAWKDGFRG